MIRWLQSGNYRRFIRGGRGSASGKSKIPYGETYDTLDASGRIKLVKGKDGVVEGRKAPVESMIPNRVYAYINDKETFKVVNIMDSNGLFQKQIGAEQIHFITDKEKRQYKNRKKSIMQNKPKSGKMGKSKKSVLENNIHVHTTLDHSKSRARYKLSSKERRIAYESIELARKKGVAIWKR